MLPHEVMAVHRFVESCQDNDTITWEVGDKMRKKLRSDVTACIADAIGADASVVGRYATIQDLCASLVDAQKIKDIHQRIAIRLAIPTH